VPTTTAVLDKHNIDYAFVPFPLAKKAVPDIGTAVIAVWKQSTHADVAWQFVRWSVEKGRLANLEERLPTQKDSIHPYIQQYYGSRPTVQPQVFEQMTTLIPPTDPFFQSPGAKQAETIIANGLAPVQAGQKTVQDALTALKPQLQALLDQYKTSA
jgi:ABC-type glycerol-3-phosphate transport system substrate-binding protein